MKLIARLARLARPAPIAIITLGLGLSVVGCKDPPPPSLAIVSIHNTSNEEGTSITYTRYDNDVVAGDASKGIVIGDGLTIVLTLGRTIADPPKKREDADALKAKPFKLTVKGDNFNALPVIVGGAPNPDRILISSIKPGKGDLEFSIEGAQGVVTMPVTVVEQGQVPEDVRPPDLPKPTNDGGSSGTGSDAGSSSSGDSG